MIKVNVGSLISWHCFEEILQQFYKFFFVKKIPQTGNRKNSTRKIGSLGTESLTLHNYLIMK